MKRYLRLLTSFLLAGYMSMPMVCAQEDLPYQVPSVPTSPQAEAFKRYGDVAVNPGTGVPDISIPLFEINHHGYRLPLVLRYSPSPVSPGYNYDVFGRGWALSVSSCISRSIEGMPDERTNFELDTERLDVSYSVSPNIPDNLNLKYDLFTAVLPDGSSFEFVIMKNYQGKIQYVISDSRKVKISYTSTTHNITAFKVIDEQGIEYDFAGADTSFSGTGAAIMPYGTAYVSWQLTSIRLPHSQEPITFSYGKTIKADFGRSQQEYVARFHHSYRNSEKFDLRTYTLARQYAYQMKLLTAITYGDTSILIDYTDSENTATYNYADCIRILDGDTLVREINFTQHQSGLHSSVLGSGLKCSTLDSVTLTGSDGNTSEVYGCEYAGASFSFSGTDHWGYLNTNSRQTGVANLNLFMGFDVSQGFGGSFVKDVAKDANDVSPLDKVKLTNAPFNFRAPANATSHCLLKRLIYPTGGYTEFTFENHEFLSQTDASGNYIADRKRRVKATAAGFRIREIADYTAEGICSGRRIYCYGPTQYESMGMEGIGYYTHTGTGEPTIDPNIENYMSFEASRNVPMYIPYMVKGLDPRGKHDSFDNVFTIDNDNYASQWEYYCTFCAFNFRRLLDGRQSVVYPEVTVYYMKETGANVDCSPAHCDGKTVYKYDIYEPGPQDTLFFEYPQYFGQLLYYVPQPFRYNLLKEQLDYRSSGQEYRLVRSEKRNWFYSGTSVTGYDYCNPYGTTQYIPANTFLRSLFTTTRKNLGYATLNYKEVKTYDDLGSSFQESESYGYAYGNVLSSKIRTAGSLRREWTWIRPKVTSSETTDTIIQKMLDKNMLSPILEEECSNNCGYRYDYEEFSVDDGSKLLLPFRIYETSGGSDYLHTEILSYTSNGNPLETVAKNGLHTVYLWSYGDRYLIGEIKNATLSDVETAVSSVLGMSVNDLSKVSAPDITKLKSLRNHSALSDTQVSVFTYKPLVGVTSVTDPSGKTIYYDYDPLGRLKESYYYEGNTKCSLQEYEYHYANQ